MTTRRERLEAKIAKRHQWEEARRKQSDTGFNKARQILDSIPLGQPILVDHYSSRKHRSALSRAESGIRQSLESKAMAEHHASKADGLAAQLAHNIYSDDEDAPERIRERIAELKAERETMKASNSAYKKGPEAWAAHLGVIPETEAVMRAKVESNYSFARQPYPASTMQNRGANIRRLEKRLVEVTARAERSHKAAESGLLIEGADYIRLTFPEKPSRDVLASLREAGFRWSGGSWCGYRANLPECVRELNKEI